MRCAMLSNASLHVCVTESEQRTQRAIHLNVLGKQAAHHQARSQRVFSDMIHMRLRCDIHRPRESESQRAIEPQQAYVAQLSCCAEQQRLAHRVDRPHCLGYIQIDLHLPHRHTH
jgi:hypothetical protein